MSRRLVLWALPVAAIVLLAPSLWLGTLPSNSSPQNITWASQFVEQVRAGILYPRWLPHSFDGLGSPAFYFYPPLPFWLDAVVDLLTFRRVSVDGRLSIDSAVMLWLSGAAMYAFLRSFPIGRAVALVAALGYMAAPYHLFDHYIRGAYAEFAAYIVVPLVVLGVRTVAMRRRFGSVLLAAAYGGLALSHLPVALLVSITVVPGYVGYFAWREKGKRLDVLVTCGLALVLGLSLAAPYIVPALRLQSFVSTDQLWLFRPDQSVLLFPGRGVDRDFAVVLNSIAVGCGLAAIGALVLLHRQPTASDRGEGLFWAILALVSLALIAGLVPYFWRLPIVAKVQFPWRLFVVVEFAVITALCLAPWRDMPRSILLLMTAALIALFPGFAYMGAGAYGRMMLKAHGDVPTAQDVKEYLPAAYPQHASFASADLGLEPVRDTPAISCAPAADLCAASDDGFGALSLHVRSGTSTVVTVGRFYFPSWQLDPPVPVVPGQPYALVSFAAGPGDHTWRLHRHALPEEIVGGSLFGLAALVLAGLLVFRLRGAQ
jgi:hypothetical protein